VFRTPPGVRVGRAPIDEDAIRLLEEHNPDIQFDWTHILKAPPQQPQQERSRREDRRDRREQPPASRSQLPASSSQPPAFGFQGPASRSEIEGPEIVEAASIPVEPAELSEPAEPGEPTEPREPTQRGEPAEPEPLEPEPLEAGSWEPEAERGQPAADTDVAPRYARIGAEGLARLRARYAEVMARIAEKPLDESVKEELRANAERLNPDAWVTDDEVAAALEQYESVFETLRPLVGRHPRRRRRRRV
jgi:hypothetical protein